MTILIPLFLALTVFCGTITGQPGPTELFLRGYSVLPSPRKVELQAEDLILDATWGYEPVRLPSGHIAIRTLTHDLKEWHGLSLREVKSPARNSIRLSVAKGAVQTGSSPEIEREAYRLQISPGRIEIVGNDDAGLFYGVQTFLQLIKVAPQGALFLPQCAIEDWPTYSLRFLHWDTKHHQDRMQTLKRYLDWSARFKVNRIGFELEDKFEYPSNPVIGAPGAFTSAQLQELVNYGLERNIQIVPQIQSPAHMAYVLKHPEFAHLRSDGNNYQSNVCDPRTYELIFSMYEDVIKATKGVDSFFVSTDEYYYAGIDAGCGRPYNEENRSLQWVDFVKRARDFLKDRNRRMLAWVEYPLLNKHIGLLPNDIINGVLGSDAEKIQAEERHGIQQLVYVSMQGAELLFPNHLPAVNGESVREGHLESAWKSLAFATRRAHPLGVYGAAWDDSGLHSETFWLGWALVAQNGWAPIHTSVEQTTSDFVNIYYGPQTSGMVDVYRSLQEQARFFESSWDRVVSRTRPAGYGNSYGKGIGTTRFDQTLPQPALPSLPGLDFTPVYVGRYAKLTEQARSSALNNDRLMHQIAENFSRASRNRYNLEVFLSLARLTGHHNHLILSLGQIESHLKAARDAGIRNQHEDAVGRLVAAYDLARRTVEDRRRTFEFLKHVWEKGRYAKGQEVAGRRFLHVLDDVKDHWADRRADLRYMVAPEESIGLEQWMQNLEKIIHEYATQNKVAVRPLEEVRLED
ncbi:MAG: beta-N-acetylhexosaminidase [Acidobacteriota bacterium]